jgi:phosphonate transport system permease protein
MTATTTLPPRPRTTRRLLLALAVLLLGSAWALDWNLEAVSSWHAFRAACDRWAIYLGGFAAPDLSPAMLQRCYGLAIETLSVALLGVAIGLMLAYPLALGSTRSVVLGDEAQSGLAHAAARLWLELCRLLLDAMRGVPDFLWAIVLATITGQNAVTGVLAIAISTAGIFGKVLSEQWDNVPAERYAALRSTGASRLQVFLYGIQPLGARATQSFVLMRTECAVRNTSVIGVVGGGGLGTALWDEYSDGNWARMATVLLSLLAVTATVDLLANLWRRQLRVDPNHPRATRPVGRKAASARRAVALAAVLAIVAGTLVDLWPSIQRVERELQRIDWDFVREFSGSLLVPDLGAETLGSLLHHSIVPIALALLATVSGTLGAGVLAYPGSVAFQIEAGRFTGERLPPALLALRWATLIASRLLALVLRAFPEVAWVVLLSVFWKQGITPCVIAVALHSTGVLHRVFTETTDNLSYQTLEHGHGPRRHDIFLYGALPRIWPDWRTYAFFQFEVNMRIGIALGTVGAGGLGERFRGNLDWRHFHTASSFLWAMVLLTVIVDRISRRLQLRRQRC